MTQPQSHVAMPAEAALRQTRDASGKLAGIVLVLPAYLPESFGGAEQQTRKLAIALARLGVRVSVLAPRLLSHTARREQDVSIALWRFKLRKAPSLGGRYIGSLLSWSAKLFWWLIRHRAQYQVIHIIHGRLHAVPAVIAGFLLGKPTLIKIGRGGSEHFDLDLLSRKRVLGGWYARMIVEHASAYIANSSDIVKDLRRWEIPADRIHRIPNGVEIPHLAPATSNTGTPRFVYLGRLDPEKAVDLMIRGFAQLADHEPARLTIVGDGKCRRDLEMLVDELGVTDRVSFSGSVTDVSGALRVADVFVSTSLSEGMSNALLEAMSFGVMPLVSSVSGAADIVDDCRSGLLFGSGDLEAFVVKLREAIALTPEARRAIGLAGRESVVSRYGIDQVAKRHLALYEHLLSDR